MNKLKNLRQYQSKEKRRYKEIPCCFFDENIEEQLIETNIRRQYREYTPEIRKQITLCVELCSVDTLSAARFLDTEALRILAKKMNTEFSPEEMRRIIAAAYEIKVKE